MRERHYRDMLDHPPECSLVELRKSCRQTQTAVAAALGVRQLAVSRLERRQDLHISTLRNYVAALGGRLELTVRLPGRAVRLVWTVED
jgi:transcriptional regulator with XRE-family HTH domain